ncbi:MAG: plastocyanin/azurin family copper-binding protein [Bacteroidia bacterium]
MNNNYKTFHLIIRKLSLTIAVLCFSLSSIATVHTITVSDFQFSPAALNVMVGDTISWQWQNGSHTTTSNTNIPSGAQPWNSPMTNNNIIFNYTVTVAGNYEYFCQPHAGFMTGSFTASTPVGITPKPGSKEMGVSIYPNPVERFATIDLRNIPASTKNIKIEVFDIIGNQYHSNDYKVTRSEMKVVVDLDKLNSGFGFINIITNDKKQIFRIIKEEPTSNNQKKTISSLT